MCRSFESVIGRAFADFGRTRRFAFQCVVGGVLLLGASACVDRAIAQEFKTADRPTANDVDLPWVPAVLEVADPYVPDPSIFGGHYAFDHFAGSNQVDFAGWIAAPLSNGDILEVGLVPAWGAPNSANGLWNLGLVRYNSASQRAAWTNPGNYGFFADQYLVYPNIDPPSYQYLRDVKVQNGWIYILVDVQQQSQQGLGRQDVRIIQVREDGSSFTEWPVFGYPAGGQRDAGNEKLNERSGNDADGIWHGASNKRAEHRTLSDRLRRAFDIGFDFVTNA